MEGKDHPITINVGGEVFMTSLETVQSLPDSLLAKLANCLFANSRPKADVAVNSHPNYTINQGKIQGLDLETDNADRSKFIHILYSNNTHGGDSKNSSSKQHQFHDQNQKAILDKSHGSPSSNVPILFVDRNPLLMPYILDVYRLGQLHLPSNVCSAVIKSELTFWEISEDLIGACCWKKYTEGLTSLRIIDIISRSLFNPFDSQWARDALSGMEKIWLTMERPSYSLAAKIWCSIYFTFIFISIIVFSISSLPDNRRINPNFVDLRQEIINTNQNVSLIRMMSFTTVVQGISITNNIIDIFFTIEFFVRLITSPSKRQFVRSGHNIVDIIILTITWLNFLLGMGFGNNPGSYKELQSHVHVIFNCCVVVRVLRVFHLAKHMPAMKLMYLSARESASELALLVAVVGAAVLLFGTAIFLVETFNRLPGNMGPFKHVPIAMWWAIITMTTVGYGDFYPTTTAGYFVGVVCAMSGLLLIAMPIAIIATNFSEYYGNMSSREQALRQEQFLEKHNLHFPSSFPGSDNRVCNSQSKVAPLNNGKIAGVFMVTSKMSEEMEKSRDKKSNDCLDVQELDTC